MWASCRSTMARASRNASLPAGAIFMIAIALLTGASGLRSSCANIATNSSLRRAATRSESASRLRSVTSIAVVIRRRRPWVSRPAGPVKKFQVRASPLATRSSRSPLSTRVSTANSERMVAITAGCRSP